jgi:DNA-binding CsgD family transcriptional regulator
VTESQGIRDQYALDHQAIIRMFNAGATDAEIAARIGWKPSGVRHARARFRLLRKHQAPPPAPPKVDEDWLRREFDERIRLPYSRGDDDEVRRQILGMAQDAGVAHETISRRLRQAELIGLRRTPKHSEESLARAEAMLKDGMPYRQVGEEVGIHPRTLQTRLPGLGVRPEDMGFYRQGRRLEGKLGL